MPKNGAYVLADYTGILSHVEIRCERCLRYGKWRTEKLIQRFGHEAPFPGLLTILPAEGGCERAIDRCRIYDRCEAKFTPAMIKAFKTH